MAVPLAPTLVTVVALLCCSAYFSSSETAPFSLSREWLARAAPTDSRAAAITEVPEDPHRLLVTLLVGYNVVNITLSSLLTAPLVDRLEPGIAVVVTTVVASTVILVAGEILPKATGWATLRRSHPPSSAAALRRTPPVSGSRRVRHPHENGL